MKWDFASCPMDLKIKEIWGRRITEDRGAAFNWEKTLGNFGNFKRNDSICIRYLYAKEMRTSS